MKRHLFTDKSELNSRSGVNFFYARQDNLALPWLSKIFANLKVSEGFINTDEVELTTASTMPILLAGQARGPSRAGCLAEFIRNI